MENDHRPVIAVIDNSKWKTGAHKALIAAVTALTDFYRFVLIIPADASYKPDLANLEISYYALPMLEISRSPSVFIYKSRLRKNAARLKEIVVKERAAILHINDLYNQLGLYYKQRHDPTIPLVWHARLLKSSYLRPLYPYFAGRINRADRVIAVSNAVKRDLSSEKAMLIYDYANLSESLEPFQVRDTNEPVVLVLGKAMRGKGHEAVVEGFSAVLKTYPQATLRFVGVEDSPYLKRIRRLVARTGIAHAVFFEPFTNNVEAELKRSDLVINFSNSESFSMVCLEAQFFGVPIISSDCGGPREIIVQNETGLLIEPGNTGELSQAIVHLLKHPELRQRFSENGKIQVRRKFSRENTVDQLHKLYQTLIA